jgi:hypothetical protein
MANYDLVALQISVKPVLRYLFNNYSIAKYNLTTVVISTIWTICPIRPYFTRRSDARKMQRLTEQCNYFSLTHSIVNSTKRTFGIALSVNSVVFVRQNSGNNAVDTVDRPQTNPSEESDCQYCLSHKQMSEPKTNWLHRDVSRERLKRGRCGRFVPLISSK